MRISIALATYNGAAFLQQQLDSIAIQTLLPAELVVSDDGSNDDTLVLIREFAGTAPFPIRILDKPARFGFADNFLFAATQCEHEVIVFSDQDDVWLPRKLELGLSRLVADDSLLSMHRLTLTDQALHPIGCHKQGIEGDAVFEPLALDPHNTGWGNTMMFRRELATYIPREKRPRQPGADRPLSHDTWIYVLAAALGRVSHIAAPLILYRQHPANAAGLEQSTWLARLSAIGVRPTFGFRENIAFDHEMSSLFEQLAANTCGDLSERVQAAAHRFAHRSAHLTDRLALYEAPSIATRMRAYFAALRSQRLDSAALRRRYRTLAKDLVLGVSGLSRLLSC